MARSRKCLDCEYSERFVQNTQDIRISHCCMCIAYTGHPKRIVNGRCKSFKRRNPITSTNK